MNKEKSQNIEDCYKYFKFFFAVDVFKNAMNITTVLAKNSYGTNVAFSQNFISLHWMVQS